MKNLTILSIICAVILSSCSTMYQSGQTPDDVYYSPVREKQVYARTENNNNDYNYQPYNNYETRQIRMNAYDPRWRYLDSYYNYDYSYNPYTYGYNYGYYYNPYYYNYPVYIKGGAVYNPRNTTPRTANLGSYYNKSVQVVNSSSSRGYTNSFKNYNNSNSNNNSRNNNNYNKRYQNTETRTYNNNNVDRSYNPSSSSSSSSRSTSTPSSSGSSVPRNSRGN